MTTDAPLRVLIADRDPIFSKQFAERLVNLAGWTIGVDACGTGADFLHRLYAQPYDLVFIDLDLPDMGGLDLLTRLTRTSLPLPVVVLSTENVARPAVAAMKQGVLDHLMKEDLVSLDLDGLLGRLLATFHLKRENAELHQISQMKNDFLATISHELRTPLTSILGLSELLLAERMGPIEEKQAEGLRKIVEQSQNLARLINQLLDVQETLKDRIRTDLRPLSMTETVQHRVDDLRPLFEAKGLRLELALASDPLRVKGDGDPLGKVVEHLLMNALKFTPMGGAVAVELQEVPAGTVLLTVRDSGQGIPREALPYVFQKFFHADPSLTREYGGLGLGLAYCQHVIETHGGRIWLESAGSGQGAAAHVTLARFEGEDEPVPETLAPSGRRRVLWVDDNPNMLELVEVSFSSFGDAVSLVTHQRGQEALDEARRQPPNLIVLDIMMPDMNGLEVLARLRADPATRSTPVLIVTGYREAALEAVDRGATDYFLKPFHLPEMLEKIRDILQLPKPI